MCYAIKFIRALLVSGFGLSAAVSNAQILFSDNFDTDSSANWSVFDGARSGPSDFTAQFAFDYSVHGIPSAPNSTGGTTRGLKLTVNKDDTAAEAAVSAYPLGQTFSGDYALKFDLWIAYNGPAFGGVGSTEFATFGLNHAGDRVNWSIAPTSDGVWFTVCGEGGAARDYRAYVGDPNGASVELLGVDGGFLDRNGDGTHEVEEQPDAFTPFDHIFPSPPYETPGMPGKRWVQVEVRQRGTLMTWLINGYVIAEHGNLGGFTFGNVMIGCMDIFASIANPKEENFFIYDNVRVEDLASVPVLPVVSIVATDSSAAEPADTGAFTIARTGDTAAPLLVSIRITGTASNGVDYTTLTSPVTIPAGASETVVTLTPIDDQLGEATEAITVALVGEPLLYELRENIAATVDLADDGDTPLATVVARRPVAYEFIPERKAQFNVRLTNPNSFETEVLYAVSGTAVAGTDYDTLSGSVVFGVGETNAFIDVVPIDNAALDTNRTVILTVMPNENAGYTVGSPSNATVVIRNDDLPAGVTLYADDFDTDSSTSWTVNKAHANNEATFMFDYGTMGIPPAPNSSGTTFGLRFAANTPDGAGTFTGLSASPIEQGFTGDYRLRFDMWINYNGPLNGGGTGSTFVQSAGVGTAGVTPQWAGGTHDAVWFGVTGDGGSAQDYRVYPRASIALAASGYYAAGTGTSPDARNNTHPYYVEFGRESSPPAQSSSGITDVGAVGMAWHDMLIVKEGTNISWFIDGLRIATAPDPGGLSTNIFVGYADINTGQSGNPSQSFGVVDNLRVETLTLPRPMITAIRYNTNSVEIDFTDVVADLPTAFTLEAAATVNGTYGPATGASITSVGDDQFRATVPVSLTAQFFRIQR